jgi:RIO kinase 2
VNKLANSLLSLTHEEIIVLEAIGSGMRSREWVPITEVIKISGLSPSKAEYRIGLLSEKKLLDKTSVPYEGYQIGFDAADLLALHGLVRRGLVTSLGEKAGVGKESVVYEALGADDQPLVIKFHREGRRSFKHVRRKREHLMGHDRISWLYAAQMAARIEHNALVKLYPTVEVPKPIGLARHAVAMSLAEGTILQKARLEDPGACLQAIIHEVENAVRAGLIHADLSEYNVFVGSKVSIIDWPQAVDVNHEQSEELLMRDVENIVTFFMRKHRLSVRMEDIWQKTSEVLQQAIEKTAGER